MKVRSKTILKCIEKVAYKLFDVHTTTKIAYAHIFLFNVVTVEILLKGEASIFLRVIGNRLCRRKKLFSNIGLVI